MREPDFTHVKADVQMAQQTGRKMITIPISDVMSLLSRSDTLEKVRDMIPFKVGFIYPDDLHLLMRGDLHRVGLSRKKGPKYNTEVYVYHLPSMGDKPVDLISECKQHGV